MPLARREPQMTSASISFATTVSVTAATVSPYRAQPPDGTRVRGARMVEEARLEDVGSGQAPTSPGWFVVNVVEAAWMRNDAFGGRCVFESTHRVLVERPELEAQHFTDTGLTLAVLEPGKPT